MTRRNLSRAARALLPALLLTLPVAARDAVTPGDDYVAGDFGRVLHEENGLTILRESAETPRRDHGSVNAPVFAGDTVETDPTQRVEIQLAGGTLVRVDHDSVVTFLSLPSAEAGYRDNSVLQLRRGTIRMSSPPPAEGEELRVDTASASIYLVDAGDFRIEARPWGATGIASYGGVAELSGQGASVLVRAGTRADVEPGSIPGDPYSFNTLAVDDFDRWVQRREQSLARRDTYRSQTSTGDGYRDDTRAYESLPVSLRPYHHELSRYGRWIYVADYGYCWYPLGVPAAWRPYRDGYWEYGPHGYFWVSYEPWGWAPYHYGRWTWVSGPGWCWIPGRVFAGAWVSWSWGSAHVGWAPLNYYDRPSFSFSVSLGYDAYDPRCWSFVSYRHIHFRSYRDLYVSPHDLGEDVRRHALVTRAPRVSPRELQADPQARTRAYQIAVSDQRRDPEDPSAGVRRARRTAATTRATPPERRTVSDDVSRSFPRRTVAERRRASPRTGEDRSAGPRDAPPPPPDETRSRRREFYRSGTRPRQTTRDEEQRPAVPSPPRSRPTAVPRRDTLPTSPQARSRPSSEPSRAAPATPQRRARPDARPSNERSSSGGGETRDSARSTRGSGQQKSGAGSGSKSDGKSGGGKGRRR